MEIDYDYLRTGTAIGFRASRDLCSNYLYRSRILVYCKNSFFLHFYSWRGSRSEHGFAGAGTESKRDIRSTTYQPQQVNN